MSIDEWRDAIEAIQQRVETVRAASAAPAPRPEALQEAVEVLQTSLEELRMAEEELYQQHEAVAIAQQEKAAAHQRYQALFDFAPDGYLVTDSNGLIQEANRAAAALLPFPRSSWWASRSLSLSHRRSDRRFGRTSPR